MQTRIYGLWIFGLLCICCRADAQDHPHPKHLIEAQKFLRQLRLENTSYGHGNPKIIWNGTLESHADCSGFVDALLSHCYGYDPEAYKRWFDSHRPSARRYHDAIVKQRGFKQITQIQKILPGDFLAVKYLTQKENTGHIMLVVQSPQRTQSKKPLIEQTEQWEVKIIDSSRSGHGPTDTRHKKGADGKDHEGLGEGLLRLYSAKDGTVAGFTWSSYANSEFQSPKEEDLVIGRLRLDFKP